MIHNRNETKRHDFPLNLVLKTVCDTGHDDTGLLNKAYLSGTTLPKLQLSAPPPPIPKRGLAIQPPGPKGCVAGQHLFFSCPYRLACTRLQNASQWSNVLRTQLPQKFSAAAKLLIISFLR